MELEGVTQAWLIKDEKNNQVRILSAEPKGNKAAAHIVTGCRLPLPFIRSIPTLRWSCLQGKSHQIRAHLAALGHPLIGDAKYGNKACNDRFRRLGIHSQMLHAFRVEFPVMDGCFADLSGNPLRRRSRKPSAAGNTITGEESNGNMEFKEGCGGPHWKT